MWDDRALHAEGVHKNSRELQTSLLLWLMTISYAHKAILSSEWSRDFKVGLELDDSETVIANTCNGNQFGALEAQKVKIVEVCKKSGRCS
jgi:hypothetical protein